LCYAQLDMGVDEGTVEIDGLLIVLGGFRKLTEDEVKLSTVIVNVSVVFVVRDGEFKVVCGGILVSYLSVRHGTATNFAPGKQMVCAYQVQGAS
jgi:hypothetical protein